MTFTMSYLIYDTLCMIYEGLMDKAMALHHPLSILGSLIPLYENTQGNYVMLALFMTEISNPIMHGRHMLRISGRRYTKAYDLSEIIFIGLYCYARFVANSSIGY